MLTTDFLEMLLAIELTFCSVLPPVEAERVFQLLNPKKKKKNQYNLFM